MHVTLDLTPEEAARLYATAQKNGVSASECARQVLAAHLPPAEPTDRTLELLAQWEAEDATEDPDEIRRAEEELAELKAGLNAPRAAAGLRLLFP